MGTSRVCISNSIAQNYSDGEEKSRDPVETREPSGGQHSVLKNLETSLRCRFISGLVWNVE